MKWNRMQWQALALGAGLVLSLEARAQEADTLGTQGSGNFGGMGQIAITSDLYGTMAYTSVEGPGDGFSISLKPSVDYFLKENLSLGGSVLLATTITDGDDDVSLGLRVRGGYNIWLNEKVSVWPKLGLGVAHSGAGDRTYLEIELSAPFLVHLAPHFFVGGGPGLVTQLGDGTLAQLHISTVVGGYF
ncbi:hypothetical protein [Hyalangium rubrum]|uniref:Outer membrane protein beta-barrel domain-containing protein n=1 Tax=Hyalangium rubrum TaxID=3103134 RepID=A0ABU5H1G9_9BACT|nr:hypothetical protein [Hyalangium sp. s54d21]MDY7227301.1 hypothetical protein [Hyalangium sp. s54d21]